MVRIAVVMMFFEGISMILTEDTEFGKDEETTE